MSEVASHRVRDELERAWRERAAAPKRRRLAIPPFARVFATAALVVALGFVTLRSGADSPLYAFRVAIEDALVAVQADPVAYATELYDERLEEAARFDAVGNALAASRARAATDDARRLLRRDIGERDGRLLDRREEVRHRHVLCPEARHHDRPHLPREGVRDGHRTTALSRHDHVARHLEHRLGDDPRGMHGFRTFAVLRSTETAADLVERGTARVRASHRGGGQVLFRGRPRRRRLRSRKRRSSRMASPEGSGPHREDSRAPGIT